MDTFERRITDVIAADAHGSDMLRHAKLLRDLQNAVQSALPRSLLNHLTVANLHKHTLVLNADSSSWATRARYLAPDLINSLNLMELKCEVRDIRVRVSPTETAIRRTSSATPRFSESGAATLQATSATADDADLQEVLQRLARHVKGKPFKSGEAL